MSHRFDSAFIGHLRIALVALALAASAAVAYAQTAARGTAPEREAAPMATTGEAAGRTQAAPRKPRYPVVNDARLTASPKVRYIGPAGTSDPFGGGTHMTESQCTAMANCQVVQGQGPSYATWCRCGKGKLTTFTYIHD